VRMLRISMASASVMTEAIAGRTVSEARSLYRHFERLLKDPEHGAAGRSRPARGAGADQGVSFARELCVAGWKTLDAALDGRLGSDDRLTFRPRRLLRLAILRRSLVPWYTLL